MSYTLVLLLIPTIYWMVNVIFNKEVNNFILGLYYVGVELCLVIFNIDYSLSMWACAFLGSVNLIEYLLFVSKKININTYIDNNFLGALLLIGLRCIGFIFKWWSIGRLIFLIF